MGVACPAAAYGPVYTTENRRAARVLVAQQPYSLPEGSALAPMGS
jgi:hypothetical protein